MLRILRSSGPKERSRTFATEREARRFLAATEYSKEVGTYVEPKRSRLTVGLWSAEWRAGRADLKPKTLASYDSLLKTQILPTWAEVPLVNVSNSAIVAWVASMRKSGLSSSRVRQAYHLLSAMLASAVADRRPAVNPAAGVKLPKLPVRERKYLDHDVLHALARECGDYETLVLLLGYTGLRWGEAAALRVRRLDLMRGRVDIAEAMVEVDGHAVFGPPKTHAHRTVPVPAFLRDRLTSHVAGLSSDDLVFTSPRGGVLRVSNFRRSCFDTAARRVGLEGLVPHELRHTAASLAIASGASVKGVQAMLGHASATQTLDRYGHLFGDELDTVAERIDAAVRSHLNNSRPTRGLGVVQLRAAE